MAFIYHMVPKNMDGTTLYPLSELKKLYPAIYEKEIKKYDDHPKRKELPQRILKKINCPQAEVLHFSPIHPSLMFVGLKSIFPDWNYSSLFYEIPIERIEGMPAVFFDMNKTGTYIFGEEEPDEMFELITPKNYKILDDLPKEALEFYQQWKDRGEKGAPAMGRIPHLMVKGQISIEKCKTIDWKNQP